MSVADDPLQDIARVARLHRCETVLLGLSVISPEQSETPVERLLGALDANVVILRSPPEWRLELVQEILIPMAGRGGHETLLALLLGSLLRNRRCRITFLRVLPAAATTDQVRRAERELQLFSEDEVGQPCRVVVLRSDDPVSVVAEQARRADLLILGVQRLGRRKKLFGHFTRLLAQRTSCPLIVMSSRG